MSASDDDPVFDFDDANNFLSALLDTVPSIDKSPEWNLNFDSDPQMFPFQLDPAFAPSSPEALSSHGSIDDFLLPSNVSQSPVAHVENPYYMSASLCTDLSHSQGVATAEHSPNTSYLSCHKLPEETKFGANPLFDAPSNDLESNFTESDNSPQQQMEMAPTFAKNYLTHAAPAPAKDYQPRSMALKAKVTKPKRPKISHNVIERKYRTNINTKILELRDSVPTLLAAARKDSSVTDLDGLEPASKLNKASVLTKAKEYIKHLESKNKDLSTKISTLQDLIELASCSLSLSYAPAQSLDDFLRQDEYTSTLTRRSEQPDLSFRAYANPATQFDAQTTPQEPFSRNLNANMLFGGMSVMMGSSFITNDNFSAMSAIPFFPSLLASGASSTQLVSTLQTGVFALGLALVLSSLYSYVRPLHSKESQSISATILSTVMSNPFTLKTPLLTQEKEGILSTLSGKTKLTKAALIKHYATLASKEQTFETFLLSKLVVCALQEESAIFHKLAQIHLEWKFKAFDYKYNGENESLTKLSKLILAVDGLGMFESKTFAKRLANIANRKPIGFGIVNGENLLVHADFFLKNRSDYYATIFNCRVLEIMHELNMIYLSILSSGDKAEDAMKNLRGDVDKLGSLIGDSVDLSKHFKMFQSLIAPESAPKMAQVLKADIFDTLSKVNAYFEDAPLTDDELISDDSDDISSAEDLEEEQSSTVIDDVFEPIRLQKSLVRTMNLMNEEKFILLASSLISYFNKSQDSTRLLTLLQYLKFQENQKNLTLLSFTALVKLLSTLVKTEDEETSVQVSAVSHERTEAIDNLSPSECKILDSLAKLMRGWLNDDCRSVFLSHKLRTNLSDLVINKTLALSEK